MARGGGIFGSAARDCRCSVAIGLPIAWVYLVGSLPGGSATAICVEPVQGLRQAGTALQVIEYATKAALNGGTDGIRVGKYAGWERMTRDWLKVERHGISRRATIIAAVAAVVFAVAIAAGAWWMHVALTSR
jgi:hypothetical protein